MFTFKFDQAKIGVVIHDLGANVSNKKIAFILAGIEVSYVICATLVTVLLRDSPLISESLKTALRILTLLVYVPVYLKYFRPQRLGKSLSSLKCLILTLAIGFLFLFPLFFQKSGFTGLLSVVWFWASFIVGFREEIFYRGIIQSKLADRFGLVRSILLTSTVFTVYHVSYFIIGNWVDLLEVFCWSIAIGIIFYQTRSILLVSLTHGVYDAIPFVTPLYLAKTPYSLGILLLVISIVLGTLTLLGNKPRNLTSRST